MKHNLLTQTLTSFLKSRSIQILFAFIIIPGLSEFPVFSQEIREKIIFVAPQGSDSAPGTMARPMATIGAARDEARRTKNIPVKILLLPGDYFLTETVELTPDDNGLTIEASQDGAVNLFGGVRIQNWKKDSDNFWYAELPEVRGGTWDFRALVVNGRLAERARFPESGTFVHRQSWDIRVLPAVAGYWERPPEPEELLIMSYDPVDIPETLDVRNAEVRVYHMWNESFIGLEKNDLQNHRFTFSSPTIYPPGAFGIKNYVIFNTREGMSKPGQWYLERTSGRIVYWPLENENMQEISVIAPKIERIIRITGASDKKVENIRVAGLTLQATTVPLKSAGFGASGFDGAVTMSHANRCTLENLTIHNTGGLGISAQQMSDCRIQKCHIFNTGACGFKINGMDIHITNNYIHNVGIYYPSAAAFYATGGNRFHIYRNEIHDAPYSGMILGRTSDLLVEENLIYRVMREMHDGGAIYGSGANNCLRGNVVRDITAVGQGFGVSAYYFDEGASDCILERNISIGVPRPTHNHIANNIIIRDNTFITEDNMALSFQRSANVTFERNTLVSPGRINIVQPNAVNLWKDNVVISKPATQDTSVNSYVISNDMPPYTIPGRKSAIIEALRTSKAPVQDGDIVPGEYPGDIYRLDRELSRLSSSGAPVLVRLTWDNKYLYISAVMTMFEPEKMSLGDKWGRDDAVEISLAGFASGNKPVTYIIRSYANGIVQCLTDGGVPQSAAENLRKNVKFAAKIREKPGRGGGWNAEWAIPFSSLGIKAETNKNLNINICAFVNEYGELRCWEGTLGETWDLSQAGTLRMK